MDHTVRDGEVPAPCLMLLGGPYGLLLMRRFARPGHLEVHSARAVPRRPDHCCVDRETAAECHPSSCLPFKTGETTLDMGGMLSVA